MNNNEAIAHYKNYALKHLGSPAHLSDLYLADFEPSEGDEMAQLEIYLKSARNYATKLSRAAHLRQMHFETFLTPDTEESGHRAWRVGMNQIALDAQKKVQYWESRKNIHWDHVYTPTTVELYQLATKIDNPEPKPVNCTTVYVVKLPPIPKAMIMAQENLLLDERIQAMEEDQIRNSQMRHESDALAFMKIASLPLPILYDVKQNKFLIPMHELRQSLRDDQTDRVSQLKGFLTGCQIQVEIPNSKVDMQKIMLSETKNLVVALIDFYVFPKNSNDSILHQMILTSICDNLFAQAIGNTLVHGADGRLKLPPLSNLIVTGEAFESLLVAKKFSLTNEMIHLIGAVVACHTEGEIIAIGRYIQYHRGVKDVMSCYNVGTVLRACLRMMHAVLIIHPTQKRSDFLLYIQSSPEVCAAMNLKIARMPKRVGSFRQLKVDAPLRDLHQQLCDYLLNK